METLRQVIAELGSALVAYSGGVDSALVLDVAVEALGRAKVLGVIARSETLTDAEYERAVALARDRDWPLETIEYSELEIEHYAANPANRCYFCKDALYTRLTAMARERGLAAVCDGTNASDLGDHRPGLLAVERLGVRSPLREAGLTKDAVRAAARARGLANWSKPSGACLSSRFPYGSRITRAALAQVGAAEEFLLALGVTTCRVRHHGDTARIEVPTAEIARLVDPDVRTRLVARLRELGFTYVALDLQGYRSGSMNEPLREQRVDMRDLMSSLRG